jgi:hypothetical protein
MERFEASCEIPELKRVLSGIKLERSVTLHAVAIQQNAATGANGCIQVERGFVEVRVPAVIPSVPYLTVQCVQ